MSVRTEKLATWNPSKWGRQRKAGGHKIKKTKTKNKQGKKGKNIQASLINSKSIWEDKEEKEKRQQERGGKRDD